MRLVSWLTTGMVGLLTGCGGDQPIVLLADAGWKFHADPEFPQISYVSSPGDLDGDTIPEVIISAFATFPDYWGWGGVYYAGRLYVFSGADLQAKGTYELTQADWIIRTRSNPEGVDSLFDPLPATVRSYTAGDVDGDGKEDLLVAASEGFESTLTVIPGTQFIKQSEGPTSIFTGEAEGSGRVMMLGDDWFAGGMGDLNGDGWPEVGLQLYEDGYNADTAIYSIAEVSQGGSVTTGELMATLSCPENTSCYLYSWGDVDGGGVEDKIMFTSDVYVESIQIFRGEDMKGGVVLSSAEAFATISSEYGLLDVHPLPDLDGDDRADLAVATWNYDGPRLISGAQLSGGGDFEIQQDLDGPVFDFGDLSPEVSMVTGDQDGDGMLELYLLLGSTQGIDGEGEPAESAGLGLAFRTQDVWPQRKISEKDSTYMFSGGSAEFSTIVLAGAPVDLDLDGRHEVWLFGEGQNASEVYAISPP